MGFDGPLSAQEQMYILYEIKLQCYQNLSNIDLESTGTKLSQKELQFYTMLCWLKCFQDNVAFCGWSLTFPDLINLKFDSIQS